MMSPEPMTFGQSEEFCNSHGSKMFLPKNKNENDMLAEIGRDFWISGFVTKMLKDQSGDDWNNWSKVSMIFN